MPTDLSSGDRTGMPVTSTSPVVRPRRHNILQPAFVFRQLSWLMVLLSLQVIIPATFLESVPFEPLRVVFAEQMAVVMKKLGLFEPLVVAEGSGNSCTSSSAASPSTVASAFSTPKPNRRAATSKQRQSSPASTSSGADSGPGPQPRNRNNGTLPRASGAGRRRSGSSPAGDSSSSTAQAPEGAAKAAASTGASKPTCSPGSGLPPRPPSFHGNAVKAHGDVCQVTGVCLPLEFSTSAVLCCGAPSASVCWSSAYFKL